MNYEWNPKKNAANIRAHGIDFADVVTLFENDDTLSMPDEDADRDEERYIAIGFDAHLQIVVVAYTLLSDTVRIISARRATKREKKIFERQT